VSGEIALNLQDLAPAVFGSVADTKLAAVIAPALTIGDIGLSLCSSSASTELNAAPVGSAPTLR